MNRGSYHDPTSADAQFDPFNGPKRGRAADFGARLDAPDWKKTTLVPGQWKVFSASDVMGTKAPTPSATKVKAPAEEVPDAAAWRKQHEITVVSQTVECPPPITTFAPVKRANASIAAALSAQGFTSPTPIQCQSWPILLEGRDLVGIAKTGSGKTLAFMVPALLHIAAQPPLKYGDGPLCVVLAPTRELAQQIEVETRKVLPGGVRCACIYGGAPKGPQLAQLAVGVHIIVATPGRLIDFLESRRTNLLRVTFVVLDEADRMLDMGFEPQVKAICQQVREDRQMIMFSATWPREIQALAAAFQRNYIRIHVGSADLLANPDVAQHFVFTTESDKLSQLRKLLLGNHGKRCLVFAKMKRTADELERHIRAMGISVYAIHGDKEQAQRDYVLNKFRKESNMTLVATDVAARGLDIKELDMVINYDFPMQIDDYVHRIGRTGRAGAKGDAFTLITKREDQVTGATLATLVKILEEAKQTVPKELLAWKEDLSYAVVRRNPNNFKMNSNYIPAYHHNSRPQAGGAPSASRAAPTAVFGMEQNPKVTKFADDDDDDDRPAVKRSFKP